MSLGPSFHPALLRAPAAALRAGGVPMPTEGLLAELLRGGGPERVPLDLGYDAWRELERSAGRDVGVRAALAMDEGAVDLADYLVGACHHLADAVGILHEHHRLFHDVAYFRVERVGEHAHLVVTHDSTHAPPPSMVEWALLTWGTVLRGLMPSVRFLEARCRHRAPSEPSELFARVPLPMVFEAEANAVVVPWGDLHAENPRADARLRGLLLTQAARQVSELPPLEVGLVERVRHELARRLRDGVPSAEDVAHALHLSPRTLRRRLEAEGATFSDVLDGLRRDEARRLVTETALSFDAISCALGFAQTASFHRAFRRWTGTTASAAREG
ncbi:MAG: helix-turn-helix domain-containing protein [Polyangiales bacterium]